MKHATPGIFVTGAARDEHLTAGAFVARLGAGKPSEYGADP